MSTEQLDKFDTLLKKLQSRDFLTQETLAMILDLKNYSSLISILDMLWSLPTLNIEHIKYVLFACDSNFSLDEEVSIASLYGIIDMLKKHNLLNIDNIDLLTDSPEKAFLDVYAVFNEVNAIPINQENYELLFKVKPSYYLGKSLNLLNQAGILTEENRNRLINCEEMQEKDYEETMKFLERLKEFDLLNQKNFEKLMEDPEELPDCLQHFINLLSGENRFLKLNLFNLIMENEYPAALTNAFTELKTKNLLTPDNIEIMKDHFDPDTLANSFIKLNNIQMLTTEN